MKPTSIRCADCGETHDPDDIEPAFREPDPIAALSARERSAQVTELGDFRVWNDGESTHFFIRGLIEVPRVNSRKIFAFGVWTTLSEASFRKATALYDADEAGGPFFGWLSNHIPGYPDTAGLKTRVHIRSGVRPFIELEPTDHPLAVQQREGIRRDEIAAVLARFLHPGKPIVEA